MKILPTIGGILLLLDIIIFMTKSAVISGISGQAGSYLAELLLNEGYKVYGMKRRSSSLNTQRIDHIFDNKNLELFYGDLSDQSSIDNLIINTKPDLFFNMAAMSHVKVSFEIPTYTMDVTGTGVIRILESIRKNSPETHFLQASSSEMFGGMNEKQNEDTKFYPRSPYAVAKAAAYYAVVNYREAYGIHASNAICFNYESPRRGETFVSRKITRAATRIKLGLQSKLYMGNVHAKRDWSHAKDTVDAMFKIATAPKASDYVVSSDENYTIEQFLIKAFSKLDLDYKEYLEFDPKYLRPTEVDNLLGDSSKIRKELNWKPKYSFEDLVNEMIEHDLELAAQEQVLKMMVK